MALNTLPPRTVTAIKICIKAYLLLLLILLSVLTMYFLKAANNTFFYIGTLVIVTVLLHKIFNHSSIALIRFNLVRKSVLQRMSTYGEVTKKEQLFNSVVLAPITLLVGTGLYATDNLMIKGCMLIIVFIFLLVGETAKYRFKLYKNWYDNNL